MGPLQILVLLTILAPITPQIITTVAGSGFQSFFGDTGPATAAALYNPFGIATDSTGNFYIGDAANNRVRKVSASGIITTIAGNGNAGFSGDGGAATNAALYGPNGVAVDSAGNVFFCEYSSHRVRKISSGFITTLAGSSNYNGYGGYNGGYSGDGGLANSALLNSPRGVAVDSQGNVYIADANNHRIRKVTTYGVILTIAGTGFSGFVGDGGPAVNAALNYPSGVAVDLQGNIFIADTYNNRVRKIDTIGFISTIAGNGLSGFYGNGDAATSASLYSPTGVSVDGFGNVFIADTNNNRIRKVDSNGIISTIAGNTNNQYNYFGDGGLAGNSLLNNPQHLAVDTLGNIFFSDYGNNRIRMIAPVTPTPSASVSTSATPTRTQTTSITVSPTPSPSLSCSPSLTRSQTPTASITPSLSATPTMVSVTPLPVAFAAASAAVNTTTILLGVAIGVLILAVIVMALFLANPCGRKSVLSTTSMAVSEHADRTFDNPLQTPSAAASTPKRSTSSRRPGSSRSTSPSRRQSKMLPEGWEAMFDDDGDMYFMNKLTEETTWERPTKPATRPLPPGWEELVDEEGATYYSNMYTGETVDERPTKAASRR
jgi:sugar lactone lactonase YvrE